MIRCNVRQGSKVRHDTASADEVAVALVCHSFVGSSVHVVRFGVPLRSISSRLGASNFGKRFATTDIPGTRAYILLIVYNNSIIVCK